MVLGFLSWAWVRRAYYGNEFWQMAGEKEKHKIGTNIVHGKE
jgi:hypothetical protein